MAKIVFPDISITPASNTVGVSVTAKPRVKIPHIVGTGSNGVTLGKVAKPILTGAGSLGGKVWRLQEAVDINGNNAPSAVAIPCSIVDITPTGVYPAPTYTEFQFTPQATIKTSQHYEFEIEDELDFVEDNAPAGNNA
jgi:hypothetical protein